MNESKQEFITIQKATKIYGFSSQILRKWEKAGLIKSQRTPRNTRMYRRCDLESALDITESQELDMNVCYIGLRSSSLKTTRHRFEQLKLGCEERNVSRTLCSV